MPLPRETATHAPDLPHAFEDDVPLGSCKLCQQPPFDPRHLAWEKAHEAPPAGASTLPRETGV